MALSKVNSTDFFSDFVSKVNSTIDNVNAMSGVNGIDVTSPTDGDILTYNDDANKWANSANYASAGNVSVNSGNKVMLSGIAGNTYITFNSTSTPPRIEFYVNGVLEASISSLGVTAETE